MSSGVDGSTAPPHPGTGQPESQPTPAISSYRVFGYGSLIFKPPPHFITQTPGFLKGFVRRFAQSSNDHRGTPDDPGRVVTLISIEDWNHFSANDSFPHEDIVWGVTYTIDPEFATEVKAYLDYREKNGYTETTVDVWNIENGKEVIVESQVTVYVGKPDNPAFVGSEPYDQLAQHIWTHEGRSGKNKDYLLDLAKAIRELAPDSHDSHLFALEKRVRALEESKQPLKP